MTTPYKKTQDDFFNDYYHQQFIYLSKRGMNFYILYEFMEGRMLMLERSKSLHDNINQLSKNGDIHIEYLYEKESFTTNMKDGKRLCLTCDLEHDEKNMDFLVYFYDKFPQYRKTILKNFFDYASFHNSNDNHLFKFIEKSSLNKDKKTLTQFIKDFPISGWQAHNIKIENFVDYLTSQQFNAQEIDEVLFSFIKARSNQLKQSPNTISIRDFLLERQHYNQENLKDYFSFFPILADYFIIPDIDYVVDEAKYDFNLRISLKKLVKSFAIEGWSDSRYEMYLPIFLNSIKEFYNLNLCEIIQAKHDNNDKIIDILVTYNHDKYSKKQFTDCLSDLLSYLRTDPNYPITKDKIKLWFSQYDLKNKIDHAYPLKNESDKKKIKL